MQKIQDVLVWIGIKLGLLQEQIEEITPPIKPILPPTERLYRTAVAFLNTDASPLDKAEDEYGCAETISNIIHEVFPDFPAEVLATDVLNIHLKNSSHFKQTLTPETGCIIVSPRTASTYGHTGIMLDGGGIASNNSKTGLFDINYNWDTWINTFGVSGRKLHTYIYKPI